MTLPDLLDTLTLSPSSVNWYFTRHGMLYSTLVSCDSHMTCGRGLTRLWDQQGLHWTHVMEPRLISSCSWSCLLSEGHGCANYRDRRRNNIEINPIIGIVTCIMCTKNFKRARFCM